MPAEDYRKAYALSLINKFPPLPKGRPFPRIHLDDVVAGLRERVNDPRKQNQGAASLCGPAAFFYCVLNYKPELYVQYVIDLFTAGKARIGSLKVEPSLPCRVYAPPTDKIAAVDWIALASLRDSENTVMDYSSANDTVAGITRPGTLAGWFRHIGYQSIHDDTNYYFCKGAKEIQECDRDMRVYRDVCLLVNDNILYPQKRKSKSTFCNHWVVLDGIFQLNNNQIGVSVYSWGGTHKIPDTGSLSVQDFSLNFYGYVSGKPKYS
jgi:hypothetical protein